MTDEDTQQDVALAELEQTVDAQTVRAKAKRRAHEERRLLVPFDVRTREGRLSPAETLATPEPDEPPVREQTELVVSAVRVAIQRMTVGRPRLQRIANTMLALDLAGGSSNREAEQDLPHHEKKLVPKLRQRVKEYLEHAQGEAIEESLRREIQEMRERKLTWKQIAEQLQMTKPAVMKVALGPREQ